MFTNIQTTSFQICTSTSDVGQIWVNYDGKYAFYRFYKGYDEFEEMSLDSKYNRMKEFDKLLISFKSLKTKRNRNATQKGVNYEKC